jgi:hypothetical protein
LQPRGWHVHRTAAPPSWAAGGVESGAAVHRRAPLAAALLASGPTSGVAQQRGPPPRARTRVPMRLRDFYWPAGCCICIEPRPSREKACHLGARGAQMPLVSVCVQRTKHAPPCGRTAGRMVSVRQARSMELSIRCPRRRACKHDHMHGMCTPCINLPLVCVCSDLCGKSTARVGEGAPVHGLVKRWAHCRRRLKRVPRC